MVFGSRPFLKGGILAGDGGEKADDNADWCGFHVVTEPIDDLWILLWVSEFKAVDRLETYLDAIMAIELHLLPYREQD